MRTFVAIELSDDIKNALAQVQSHLKYAGADVKWVAKENIHLTLKFLGEIDDKKCEEVKAALDEIARDFSPFEISIKDIGAFPKIDYPRVIWAGLDKGAKEGVRIALKVDDALSKLGFAKETRPFAAHLTIGRVRSSKNKAALKEKIDALNSKAPLKMPYAVESPQLISTAVLFQSTLTPKGSIYSKLHEAKLGTPNP